MADVASQFIVQTRGFLSSDYLPKIERCLEALSDEDVWWRANEGSNSIGNSMHTGQIIMLATMRSEGFLLPD
jgi:chromosome condensin MukBEF ATPase and DNA-binding subunit MukB